MLFVGGILIIEHARYSAKTSSKTLNIYFSPNATP
jgi:hypothetical protein